MTMFSLPWANFPKKITDLDLNHQMQRFSFCFQNESLTGYFQYELSDKLGHLPFSCFYYLFKILHFAKFLVESITDFAKMPVNNARDERSYSLPFFFRTAKTIFLMISCGSTGVVSSVSLFPPQAWRYSLKTFKSYKSLSSRSQVFTH